MRISATGVVSMTDIEYKSVFHDEFRDLVSLKQALGFSYKTEKLGFRRIDRFLIENGVTEKVITREISDEWCRKRSWETSSNQASRISQFRVFCTYLDSIHIPAYIPRKGLTRHSPKYDAHIYSDDELKRFFNAVDLSQSVPAECPYRAQVMPVFFRILYTSGLRVSELRLAKICDFNLTDGYLTVRMAKNHKDRIVPIHPSLVQKCIELKNAIHLNSPEDEYFFIIRPGREMKLNNIYHNFRRYLDKAGIPHTGKGPRVHDFRHTYCVNLLRKWVEEEKDLLAFLPYMRTMLGHETFEETAYYLKLTAASFPAIRESLSRSFPNIIEEVTFSDKEYY